MAKIYKVTILIPDNWWNDKEAPAFIKRSLTDAIAKQWPNPTDEATMTVLKVKRKEATV